MSHFPDIDFIPASGLRGAPPGPRHGRWKRGHKSPADFAARKAFDQLADGWRLAAFGDASATVAPHLPRSSPNGIDAFPPLSPRWQRAILAGNWSVEVRRHVTTPERLADLEAATETLCDCFTGLGRRLEQAGWAVRADDLDNMALIMRDLAALLAQAMWVGRVVEIARVNVDAVARAALVKEYAAATTNTDSVPNGAEFQDCQTSCEIAGIARTQLR